MMQPSEIKLKRYLVRRLTFLTREELQLIRYLGLLFKEYAELVGDDYAARSDEKKYFESPEAENNIT